METYTLPKRGPSGLNILQSRQKIDLLVTDIGLPGLNGRQIADAARLVRPELKILFMTGYAETAAMTEGTLAAGQAPYRLTPLRQYDDLTWN